MTKIICTFMGHREFSDEVLAIRPWQDPDFAGYSREDFREGNCLRCGGELGAEAA